MRGSVIDPVCRCVLVEWFAREERGGRCIVIIMTRKNVMFDLFGHGFESL